MDVMAHEHAAGIELMRCQVLVVGNVEGAASTYVSGHHILADLIDADGVRAALRSVGITVEGTVSEANGIVSSMCLARAKYRSTAGCGGAEARC